MIRNILSSIVSVTSKVRAPIWGLAAFIACLCFWISRPTVGHSLMYDWWFIEFRLTRWLDPVFMGLLVGGGVGLVRYFATKMVNVKPGTNRRKEMIDLIGLVVGGSLFISTLFVMLGRPIAALFLVPFVAFMLIMFATCLTIGVIALHDMGFLTMNGLKNLLLVPEPKSEPTLEEARATTSDMRIAPRLRPYMVGDLEVTLPGNQIDLTTVGNGSELLDLTREGDAVDFDLSAWAPGDDTALASDLGLTGHVGEQDGTEFTMPPLGTEKSKT